MRKFSPTNKFNPCPVCEDISGKCRYNSNDFYLCMTLSDAKFGEVINGFKCVGNKGNGWASFKTDNTAEWSQERRQEWEQQRKARREQADRENADRKQRSLSAEERDREYRQILNSLTLHPDDLASLQRRGFTPEEIKNSRFKSVTGNQWLKFPANSRLPGVSYNGKHLICQEGYLCPIRNPEGQIIGAQVRLRHPQDDNRYKWLSSKNAVLRLFPDGSKEGENPLGFFHQTKELNQIWIVEGTGAKPFLLNSRLGVTCIAAAGGQFCSSPQLFKEYLEKASIETGSREIIIPPDAGDVCNPSVMWRWRKVVKLIKNLGYSVKFAWWGQFSKEDCDIDELEDYSQIQFITPEAFYKLQPQALPKTESHQLPNTQDKKPKSTGDQSAKNLADNVIPPSQKTYAEKATEEWRKSRHFTAKHIIENPEGWLKWPVPKENTITFIRSGLGTGKTTQVTEWLIELINEPWRNLGYRNTLLLQFCAKTDKVTEQKLGNKDGFWHLHEHNASLFILDPTGKISTCVHSILRFKPEDFDGCNLLLDETVSVIRTLFEDDNIRKHEQVLRLFTEAVRRARRVICLDGLMNDWTVKYISALAPDKEVVTVKNIDNRPKPIVNFLSGTIDLNEETIKKNDRSPWLELIFEHAQRPAIATDSQIMAEWLDEALSEKGYKVLRIDSKTVPEDYVKEFMQECDEYIAKEQPDVLIYTPSAESGLDVSIKNYFTHHIAFFFGVLSVDSYLQMLGRIRDSIPKFVWCREWIAQEEGAASRSPFPRTLFKSLLSVMELDIIECFSTEVEELKAQIISRLTEQIQQANNIHFQTSVQIRALANHERGNLRSCLLEAIQEAGYPVRLCTLKSNEELKDQNKNGTETVKRRNCHDIFTAEKIDIADTDFGGNFDARWEERVKTIQASYRKQLPGIEETSSWTEDFIYKIRYEDPKFITHNRRYWLFKNSAVALRIQQERWNWIFHQEEISLSKIRSERALIEALRKVGLEEVINSDREWSEENPVIQRITEACKEPEISNALGRHPGKSNPIQWIGRLLGMLGLKFKGSQKRQNGDRVRLYRITNLHNPDRLNTQACLTRKYEKYLSFEVEELRWDETLAPQGFEGVTPPPENVYKLGMRCDSNSELKAKGEMFGFREVAVASSKPETFTTQGLEGVTPPPENIYSLGIGCDNNNELRAKGEMSGTGDAAVASELSEPCATFATCETFSDFATAAAKYDSKIIDYAIFCQDCLATRLRLREWFREWLAPPPETRHREAKLASQEMRMRWAAEVRQAASAEPLDPGQSA